MTLTHLIYDLGDPAALVAELGDVDDDGGETERQDDDADVEGVEESELGDGGGRGRGGAHQHHQQHDEAPQQTGG